MPFTKYRVLCIWAETLVWHLQYGLFSGLWQHPTSNLERSQESRVERVTRYLLATWWDEASWWDDVIAWRCSTDCSHACKRQLVFDSFANMLGTCVIAATPRLRNRYGKLLPGRRPFLTDISVCWHFGFEFATVFYRDRLLFDRLLQSVLSAWPFLELDQKGLAMITTHLRSSFARRAGSCRNFTQTWLETIPLPRAGFVERCLNSFSGANNAVTCVCSNRQWHSKYSAIENRFNAIEYLAREGADCVHVWEHEGYSFLIRLNK